MNFECSSPAYETCSIHQAPSFEDACGGNSSDDPATCMLYYVFVFPPNSAVSAHLHLCAFVWPLYTWGQDISAGGGQDYGIHLPALIKGRLSKKRRAFLH